MIMDFGRIVVYIPLLKQINEGWVQTIFLALTVSRGMKIPKKSDLSGSCVYIPSESNFFMLQGKGWRGPTWREPPSISLSTHWQPQRKVKVKTRVSHKEKWKLITHKRKVKVKAYATHQEKWKLKLTESINQKQKNQLGFKKIEEATNKL